MSVRYTTTVIVYEVGAEDRRYEIVSVYDSTNPHNQWSLDVTPEPRDFRVEVDRQKPTGGRPHEFLVSHCVVGFDRLHGPEDLEAFRAHGKPGERRWARVESSVVTG